MGARLQGAGRPVCVINDSDRPDLTHSITLSLTHHKLIYHTDTWQPHPASPRHQPRTGATPSAGHQPPVSRRCSYSVHFHVIMEHIIAKIWWMKAIQTFSGYFFLSHSNFKDNCRNSEECWGQVLTLRDLEFRLWKHCLVGQSDVHSWWRCFSLVLNQCILLVGWGT